MKKIYYFIIMILIMSLVTSCNTSDIELPDLKLAFTNIHNAPFYEIKDGILMATTSKQGYFDTRKFEFLSDGEIYKETIKMSMSEKKQLLYIINSLRDGKHNYPNQANSTDQIHVWVYLNGKQYDSYLFVNKQKRDQMYKDELDKDIIELVEFILKLEPIPKEHPLVKRFDIED